jgi:flagellar protein FliO/FliZ
VQFITGLFGGSGNTILTVIFALGAVIVLIILAVWLLKVISKVSGTSVRGRSRRLGVVETLVIDQKRQLLIVRRDNVEHLILTGSTQDILVETGIAVVEAPISQPLARRQPLPQAPLRNVAQSAPAPVAESIPEAPVVVPKAEPDTLLEQLQKSGHTGERKTRVSLRKTGLMRQSDASARGQAGQNPDISDAPPADSVHKTDHRGTGESTALEDDSTNDTKQV